MTPGPVDPAAAALQRVQQATRSTARRRQRRTPPRFTGSGPDPRDPRLLGAALDDWVRGNGYADQLAVGGLRSRWSQMVGEQVAAHAEVVEYRPAPGGGTVVLRADSAAWALQLRYLSERILTCIGEHIGPRLVTKVEVQGPAPARGSGRLRVRSGRRSPRG